jgi:hypothetical protein
MVHLYVLYRGVVVYVRTLVQCALYFLFDIVSLVRRGIMGAYTAAAT